MAAPGACDNVVDATIIVDVTIMTPFRDIACCDPYSSAM
jgi:uncharacterized protein YkvS